MHRGLAPRPVREALLVAYHFPPAGQSSGVQRALKLARYLPRHGWRPRVLTVHPRAYPSRSDAQMHEIDESLEVRRAFGLDTARHLALMGRHFGFMALPDRWVSWWLGAVFSGWRMCRQNRPDVIWSTYPIATAHLIGLTLSHLTGIPWVADFRDSMTEDDYAYPRDPRLWHVFRRLERRVMARCNRAVFTTPGARRMYEERYPDVTAERFAVIPNGYDEENFAVAERRLPIRPDGERLVLLHSGVLYPEERDPRALYAAISALKRAGRLCAENFELRLRATAYDDFHARLIAGHGIEDVVRLLPSIGYEDALTEMMSVDGLLVMQSAGCNHQIPAKVYEYLRAGRPIVALTDNAGDTAALLREAGVGLIAPLDDVVSIEQVLDEALGAMRSLRGRRVIGQLASRYSRQVMAGSFADLFDELAGGAT